MTSLLTSAFKAITSGVLGVLTPVALFDAFFKSIIWLIVIWLYL